MSSICAIRPPLFQDPTDLKHTYFVQRHEERNARITALALGFVALFLFACASILFGLGSLGPTYFMGLGLFPSLGGVMFSCISVTVLAGAAVFAAIAAVRSCEKARTRAALESHELS